MFRIERETFVEELLFHSFLDHFEKEIFVRKSHISDSELEQWIVTDFKVRERITLLLKQYVIRKTGKALLDDYEIDHVNGGFFYLRKNEHDHGELKTSVYDVHLETKITKIDEDNDFYTVLLDVTSNGHSGEYRLNDIVIQNNRMYYKRIYDQIITSFGKEYWISLFPITFKTNKINCFQVLNNSSAAKYGYDLYCDALINGERNHLHFSVSTDEEKKTYVTLEESSEPIQFERVVVISGFLNQDIQKLIPNLFKS